MKIQVTVLTCSAYDLKGDNDEQYTGFVINGFCPKAAPFEKGIVRFSSQREFAVNEDAVGFDPTHCVDVNLTAKIFGDKVKYTETNPF